MRSHGSFVNSPPATVRSNPTLGADGNETRMAPYPGSDDCNPTTMRRIAPSKRKLRTLTGTRAPTRAVVTSTSALIADCHKTSTSSAIVCAPRSYL